MAGQGGFGATHEADGYGPLMTLMHGDNPRIPDEILEAQFQIRVLDRRLRRNAGGAGSHDGGPGVEMTIEAREAMFVRTSINRTRTPAWGLAGGEPGKPAAIHIWYPRTMRWKRLGQVSHLPIAAGTRIRVRTGGGGGWGRATDASEERRQSSETRGAFSR
jgi:N-methylhydantoinase B